MPTGGHSLSESAPSPSRQLFMRRPHLRELPLLELPAGYRLRVAVPEDAPGLAAVLTAAFDETWDLEVACRRLIDDPSVAAIYVIERAAGPIVATASSRLVPAQ